MATTYQRCPRCNNFTSNPGLCRGCQAAPPGPRPQSAFRRSLNSNADGVIRVFISLGIFFGILSGLGSCSEEFRKSEERTALERQMDERMKASIQAQFDRGIVRVQLGMDPDQVVALVGAPDHTQSFDREGSHDVNYYYPGGYQLCFDNGRLESINKY